MANKMLDEVQNELEKSLQECTWSVLSKDKNSTTFKAVRENHKLYDCVECSGDPGSCPNYINHEALIRKYQLR